jgi:hypothetical protein
MYIRAKTGAPTPEQRRKTQKGGVAVVRFG